MKSICLALFLTLATVGIAIMPRQQAPDFTAQAVMHDLSFKSVSLSDYLNKYVVLLFYPLDFTYVCPTEIISYASKAEQFRNINAEILAVSVDSQFSHLAWRKTPRK
ncbi:UNVERIFIED_CONTAM: hypothetical protein GTU68_060552 [Idotea baltica]|nr:hypothetical protein [Idotea baltica]